MKRQKAQNSGRKVRTTQQHPMGRFPRTLNLAKVRVFFQQLENAWTRSTDYLEDSASRLNALLEPHGLLVTCTVIRSIPALLPEEALASVTLYRKRAESPDNGYTKSLDELCVYKQCVDGSAIVCTATKVVQNLPWIKAWRRFLEIMYEQVRLFIADTDARHRMMTDIQDRISHTR